MAKPAVYAVNVICTEPEVTPKSEAILGIAGTYISIANGVSAEIAPKIITSSMLNFGGSERAVSADDITAIPIK
ncbi:hypothetical protein AFI02nite_30780 [Aliivibrio fischeri]|uniref:Uncharacterized protein n=1 Tax=Aliivibrio fischeri TaxID=668 RepID=A0A510UK70_ALIFS|nr:hypothetical protein AFI02nite_30780 [Aliivibrio fischeri]